MNFKKPLIILTLILAGFNTYAGSVIDSLKAIYEKENNDSLRIYYLNEISYEFNSIDVNQAMLYAQKAINLSNQINSQFGLMRSWGQLGNAYRTANNNLKAIECYIKSERIATKLKDNVRISACAHNIGILYHGLHQYKKAEGYLLRAVESDLKLNDKYSLGISYNSLGAVYLDWGKTHLARNAFKKAIQALQSINDNSMIAMPYNNLGIIERNNNKSKQAISYFEQAFDYYRINKDDEKSARALRNIATEYHKLGDYKKVIYYYDLSLTYSPLDPENDIKGQSILSRVAESYIKTKDFKKANELLLLGVNYYQNYYQDLDSIKSTETEKAFAEMATKYETDKKEKENQIQRLEIEKEKASNAKKNTIIASFIVGLILIAILMFFVIRSYRLTRAANKKIQKQKEQIEVQRDEISFKNKEITASIEYAKSLQDAILPNEEYIRKYLPEHFILWLPRDIVSGDFYWFFERDGKIFLAAADCTGHGVPGAFVSMTCHNILNQVVIDQNNDDTGDILSKVHIAVSKVFQREGSLSRANDGMDITLVCIDQNKKKLYYSGALNPLVQISNNSIIQHKVDRFAIGGGTPMDFRFKTNEIELNSGDCFYLFSDGFKDQFGGEHGKKYMNANFVKYLQKIHPQKTDQQRSLLKEELERWVGHYERIDDVLVVGFRVQ